MIENRNDNNIIPFPQRENDIIDKNWKVRFWAVFIGQALSLVGSSLTQFVLLWWITDTTGSVSALATAGMAALLPQALLSPLGGTFADRYSRRNLMLVADSISALCMVLLIVLFLTGRIEIWHAYIMMSIRGAMQAFQGPASAASVAMLVPKSFLSRASGLNQTLQAFTTVASAPLGALAISIMPIGWALSIDVITAVMAILPLLYFVIPQPKVDKDRISNVWNEFLEGIKLVWNDRGLLRLYTLMACVVLIIMPAFTFLPLLIKTYFGGGASQVALMEGLAGIGMVAGGLIIVAIAPKRQVIWILSGFAVSCFTMAFTALTPASLFWLATTFWVLSGIFFIMGNAPLTALLQTTIPNHLQGRALSLLNMIMGLAAPVGLALATPLGELIGIRGLFVAMGLLGGIICLVGYFSRSIKQLDSE
ncbi:MFS transporter [Elizabethkingia anophelis]|uniref:MFS transporter n=1 Tax=Elizabethkingia anophelis TaxID=1117645 RepID=UPI0012B3FE25|nr:MFS transporter [Elizabethkingia anophelis]QGN22547.1 MFS transporter [Elizabethkingia anophelis]QNV09199.1 MFS transporter [Elizabethkingia anophelis]UTF90955.1 MFS transporter [Elizabethkingia anophelis]UTG01825.1 MFS transporter [Elizabethkingia anophelis]UTG05575.1 MFS transporter [Elizabethkingia anophelis]